MREDGNRRLDPPFSLFSPIIPFSLPLMSTLSMNMETMESASIIHHYSNTRLTVNGVRVRCRVNPNPVGLWLLYGVRRTIISPVLVFFSCICLLICILTAKETAMLNGWNYQTTLKWRKVQIVCFLLLKEMNLLYPTSL